MADSSLECLTRLTASWPITSLRLQPDPSSAIHCQRLLWRGCFSKGDFRRLGWSPRPFFHRLRGRRHLRGSKPVSAHAKQGRGNVGHDLRRCGIHCYELCRTTAHSRLEITLVFAALAERGSRARVVSLAYRSPGQPDALQTSPASILRRLKHKADQIDAPGTWEITVLVAMPLQIGDTPDPE